MIRNIIFDYGNVLVHFDPNWLYTKVFNGDEKKSRWFNETVLPQSWVTRLDAGEPMREVIAEKQREWPQWSEEIAAYDTRYYEMVGDEVEGMYDLLQRLRYERRMQLWGLTNWPPKVYRVLAEKRIFSLLNGMVISCEEKLVKPDPRIFHTLLQRYDLKAEECLFTDDREDNVEAAIALGMKGVVFHNAAQLEKEINNI